mmetsp:Transcript_68095/g.160186  ORF Transcript_68095/g.160186 Transcript_68095/m.160186 type:complete len:230 (+) Transcript_68095:125-814(+)
MSTHDNEGDVIFVMDITVHPDYRRLQVGRAFGAEIAKALVKENLKYCFGGMRMPGYAKYLEEVGQISAEDYAQLRDERGKLVDWELRFYESIGGTLIRVLPNYFQDPPSCNYGVFGVMDNPCYITNKSLGQIVGGTVAGLLSLVPYRWCMRYWASQSKPPAVTVQQPSLSDSVVRSSALGVVVRVCAVCTACAVRCESCLCTVCCARSVMQLESKRRERDSERRMTSLV